MRLSNYTLTPTRINNAKAKARLYKLSDGGGLFVEVSTTGQKTWRYQYRFAGSRRDVKIGRYPEIGVADARARHFEMRSLLERGVDPAEVRRQDTAERRQQAKHSQPAADQFEAFSRRWIRERLMTRSETYRNQIESRLERFVWPAIGEKPLGGVRPADVLAIIEDLRGTPKTAEGVRQHIQQIYNYAIQKLLVEVNPALPLRGVIEVPAAEHHRHLTEPELGAFWRSVAKQGAHFVTIAATRMLMYTMCRKSEVLRARWREFDLERAQWDIPAERMKMKAPHRVYLSRQALELLGLLKAGVDRIQPRKATQQQLRFRRTASPGTLSTLPVPLFGLRLRPLARRAPRSASRWRSPRCGARVPNRPAGRLPVHRGHEDRPHVQACE